MVVWLILILHLAAASLKSRRSVLLENLALRQQLLALNRGSKRPRLTPLDRLRTPGGLRSRSPASANQVAPVSRRGERLRPRICSRPYHQLWRRRVSHCLCRLPPKTPTSPLASSVRRVFCQRQVPEPAAPHVLYAVGHRADLISEIIESNNVQSVSIGETDLAVSLVSYQAETNGAVRVIAQVQNVGAPAATNSVLAIRRAGDTNAPLATAEVPMLEPGQVAQVALDLAAGTQPEGSALHTLHADDTGAVSDVATNNNTATFAVSLWLDTDDDGIPDSWMMRYFGHATGLAADNSRAQDDAHGDGMSNLTEYLAGTDPRDAHSYRQINSLTLGGTNGIQIVWGSASNKPYSIERAAALDGSDNFLPIVEHMPRPRRKMSIGTPRRPTSRHSFTGSRWSRNR